MRRLAQLAFWAAALLVSSAGHSQEVLVPPGDLAVFPPVVSPGDVLLISPADKSALPPGGTWKVAGETATLDEAGGITVTLPSTLSPGDPLEIAYVQLGGKTTRTKPDVRVLPKPTGVEKPGLALCGPRRAQGSVTCLCGWFPTAAARDGILVDGKPAGRPLASSGRSLCLRLGPGSHRISGAAAASVQVDVLRIVSASPRKVTTGEPYEMKWTVTGTQEPVQLRIRNLAPGRVRIEDGDDQVVVTSGGKDNKARRQVVQTAAGEAQTKVTLLDDPSPFHSKGYLDLLQGIFQQEIRRISILFSDLAVDAAESSERSKDLLEKTRTEIETSLPYPELAAFKDSVAEIIEQARSKIETAEKREAHGVYPAAEEPCPPKTYAPCQRSKALATVSDFLFGVRQEKLARNLRIRTTPVPGASFRIFPKSYPSDVRSTATNSSLCNLPLGRYVYEVHRADYSDILGFTVDLTRETRQVLDCSLRGRGRAAVPCSFSSGVAEDCP